MDDDDLDEDFLPDYSDHPFRRRSSKRVDYRDRLLITPALRAAEKARGDEEKRKCMYLVVGV